MFASVTFVELSVPAASTPNEVLTVAPLSYANVPSPVATINCPSDAGAPNVSKSSNTPSTPTVIEEPRSTFPKEAIPAPCVSVIPSFVSAEFGMFVKVLALASIDLLVKVSVDEIVTKFAVLPTVPATHRFSLTSYNNEPVAFPPLDSFTNNPPSFAPAFNSTILSPTSNVVEFIFVSVPDTVKFPEITTLSSIVIVPSAESNVRLPLDVSISPVAVTPTWTLPNVEPPDCPAIYVFNAEAVTFLLVPPAPLSVINKSASATASPIAVPPSISSASIETFPAVDIVFSFESAIEPPNISFVIPLALTLNVSELISIDESSTCTASVLVLVKSPPPVKPSPAVILTVEWSTCSFATNPLNES